LLTVHDLATLLVPGTTAWRSLYGDRLLFNKSLAEANAICTNSRGTAKRLRDLLGYRTDAVVRPAVSAHFSPQAECEIERILGTYGITPPYVLCVGTWEPRKNLELLVKTFLGMKADGLIRDHKLVLVGGRGWKDMRLAGLVKKAERAEVLALGYVPDSHLPALYSGAQVFVYPSIYEGFGIPVLEARACGAPVVTTDIPELHEAGGEQCIYIPPTQEGIRLGILTAIDKRVPAAQRTFVRPSWSESARLMASVLRGLGIKDSHNSLAAAIPA
jgi:glycosyltransferase involved in cell wall biosynthesis